ncbi:hypothetical protein RI367_002384 [Sorochytrium milnesiophthora]
MAAINNPRRRRTSSRTVVDYEDPSAQAFLQSRRATLNPQQGELIKATKVDIHNRDIDAPAELEASLSHLGTLKLHIERLEHEIRESFQTRKQSTLPSVYFPATDLSASAGSEPAASGAAFAAYKDSVSGTGGGGGPDVGLFNFFSTQDTTDDLVRRARNELMVTKSRALMDQEQRNRAVNDSERKRNAEIAKAKKTFADNAALAAAGPTYRYNFMTTGGSAVYIERVDSTDMMVFNSKGQIEVWHEPPSSKNKRGEQGQQLFQLQDLLFLGVNFPRVVSVTKLSPNANENTHMTHHRQHYCDEIDSARHTAAELQQRSQAQTAASPYGGRGSPFETHVEPAGLGSPPMSSSPLSSAQALDDPEHGSMGDVAGVDDLSSTTYDLGGQVPVADEEKIKAYNYYNFLGRWINAQNTNNIAGTVVTRRQSYLVGCINGDACVLDLAITEDRASGEKSYVPTVRSRTLLSLSPVLHAAYFAAGHHVAVLVQSRNNSGKTEHNLIGYKIPGMEEEWRLSLVHLLDRAKAAKHITSADLAASHYCLEADNIKMALYLSIGHVVFQLRFDQLPILSANTFFNQATEHPTMPLGQKQLTLVVTAMLSTLQHDEPPEPNDPDEGKPTDEDDDDGISQHHSRSSLASATAGTATGSRRPSSSRGSIKDGDRVTFLSSEISDVCSVTPFTSASSFKSYLLIGCMDSSLRCISVEPDAFGDEIFYYSSDYTPAGYRLPVTGQVLIMNGDVQLAIGLGSDGALSILSIDRRALLSETRVLHGRKSVPGGLHRPNASEAPTQPTRPAGSASPPAGQAAGPAPPAAASMAVASGMDRHHQRAIFLSSVESRTLAVSAGKEWSLMNLYNLISWLEDNPKTSEDEYII